MRRAWLASVGGALALGAVAAAGWVAPVGARQRVVLSPHEVHEFDAGGCHFTINYGRPSKRGRVIWGSLVRWDMWWMPGADAATILTTTKPIVLGTLSVPAGDHTLYLLMNERASDLVINNEVGQFHTHYDPSRNLGQTSLSMTHLDAPVEQLTLTVAPEGSAGGRFTLSWDDRAYWVSLTVK